MKKIIALVLFSVFVGANAYTQNIHSEKKPQQIFVYGGDIEPKFVEYVKDLVNKAEPRICYLPTASADNPQNIKYWEHICKSLNITPYVLNVWIDSDTQKQSFEDIILSMDAIVVGGGNTLNMLGIWKAQGIDKSLKKALDNGIILSGGSAGSICWFEQGVSDSRPVELSIVEGLGFLPYSHCPHYDIASKRNLYDDCIKNGGLPFGYACDDHSGILFVDSKVKDVVSSTNQAHSYLVKKSRKDIEITKLESRVLVKKGALDTTAYKKEPIGKKVSELSADPSSMQTPISAFVLVQNMFAEGKLSEYHKYAASSIKESTKDLKDRDVSPANKESKLSTMLISTFVCKEFAAVLSKGTADYYSLWYFVREDGLWKCRGEDIGGDSPADAEITFREKAPNFLKATPGK